MNRTGRHKLRHARDGRLQEEVLGYLEKSIPGFQRLRWRDRTLEAFSDTEEVRGVEDEFRDYILGFRYLPDGFVIDRDEMRLDFFEVEITSLMTDTKLQAYGEFTTIMHHYGIEFGLHSVSQHAHINQVPLLGHYLTWVTAANAASPLSLKD